MTQEMILAGFGGQGVLLMGQLLTYAGMIENKHVSWIPSYGPEMRGGTANCSVIISDEPVGAPIVTEPTTVVAMNRPSLDKFEPLMKANGTLFINSSLINRQAQRTDITAHLVPANDVAAELGNLKVANMVMLGAVLAATNVVNSKSLMQAFSKMFAHKPELIELNERAIRRGMELIKK